MKTAQHPFTNDLFISYAHRDDEPLPTSNAGWVRTLYGYIRHQLGVRLGRDPKLWIDFERMDDWAAVTGQLISNAQDSAALLVILSKSYLNSEWVRKERNEFLKLLDRRGVESIFVVEIDEIDRAELPRELADLRTFPFWKPLHGGAPKALGFPDPAVDQDYSDRVVELCYQIARLLETSSWDRPSPEL